MPFDRERRPSRNPKFLSANIKTATSIPDIAFRTRHFWRKALQIVFRLRPIGRRPHFNSKFQKLKAVDGWLANVMCRAVRARAKLLTSMGYPHKPLPKAALLAGNWYQDAIWNDVRIASFFLAWRASNTAWERYGPKGIHIPHGAYGYAGDDP